MWGGEVGERPCGVQHNAGDVAVGKGDGSTNKAVLLNCQATRSNRYRCLSVVEQGLPQVVKEGGIHRGAAQRPSHHEARPAIFGAPPRRGQEQDPSKKPLENATALR